MSSTTESVTLFYDIFMLGLKMVGTVFIIAMILTWYLGNREASFVRAQVNLMSAEMIDDADKQGGFTEESYNKAVDKYTQTKLKTWVKKSDVKIIKISPAMGTKRTYVGQPVSLVLEITPRYKVGNWFSPPMQIHNSSVNRGEYGLGYTRKG